MTLILCCVLFVVAPLTLSAKVPAPIDPQTLQSVFGSPYTFSLQADASSQAAVVSPNATLTDPDYWDSNDDFTPSSSDYDKFDWTLTKRVAASSNQDFLLSPLGLKMALAILTEAATGPTQAELASVLGFDSDRNVVRSKFGSIVRSLETKSSKYVLKLGSRIYIQKDLEPRQRFAAVAQEFYKAELSTVDFHNPPVASGEINAWVSNLTEGRIPNLVTKEDIEGNAVLILNTLFFKGTWRHQFLENQTKLGNFYVTPAIQKQVAFMNVRDNFYYAESNKLDAKILRLPYMGYKFAMYIVVPNSLSGLPRVLNSVSELRNELFYLQKRIVDVTLPKFKFDYTSLLDGVLRELGVRQAFEDTASFPGIARGQKLNQRLKVTKVLQKAGIEVNELGSVAYAATEIGLENKFGEDDESVYEVVANKPFLFYIEDENTRQLLFTGRVSDPIATDGAFKV